MKNEPPPSSADERMAAWLKIRIQNIEEEIADLRGQLSAHRNSLGTLTQLQKAADESQVKWRSRYRGDNPAMKTLAAVKHNLAAATHEVDEGKPVSLPLIREAMQWVDRRLEAGDDDDTA